MWDDYHIFLIVPLVFTRLLLDEIYHLIELPFDWLLILHLIVCVMFADANADGLANPQEQIQETDPLMQLQMLMVLMIVIMLLIQDALVIKDKNHLINHLQW